GARRGECLGRHCVRFERCVVMNARKPALGADVVFISRRLFVADVMLKDEGLAELLPTCNTVILDEPHQLPDTATLFFGEEISAGSLGELARDAETEGLRSARDYAPLPDAAQMVAQALRRFRLSVGDVPGKWLQSVVAQRPGFTDALDTLGDALSGLARELGHQAERSDELAQCATRATDSIARLTRWREGLRRPQETSEDSEWIRWLDVSMHGWQLRASPLSVAEIFSNQVTDDARAWIFTSATLAIGGDFALYQRELGLGGATTGYWESPFDY